MEEKKYCYHVHFFAHGEVYETMGYSEEILTAHNAEGFAWGVLRCVLKEKNIPLTDCATNIEVIDGVTNQSIWKCDIIEIPGSDEMQNAIQNKN